MAAKKKTNRQILECIESKVSQLDKKLSGRIDQTNDRLDQTNTRIDSLHGRFDDLRTAFTNHFAEVNEQFTNHLSSHGKLNKSLIKGGLVLVGMIIVAVGANNFDVIVKIVTAAVRWI